MREYKIILTCEDTNNPNEISHYTQHVKEISEELYNIIYKLLS